MQDTKIKPELILEEWIKKAGEDELSCKSILKHRDGAPSSVCFMSQQMAEKYLKGFLVYKEKYFPKIHDLKRILSLCKEIEKDFEKLNEEAVKLSEYCVETRYPGDYPEGISWKMAEEAFELANNVKNFVKSQINNND